MTRRREAPAHHTHTHYLCIKRRKDVNHLRMALILIEHTKIFLDRYIIAEYKHIDPSACATKKVTVKNLLQKARSRSIYGCPRGGVGWGKLIGRGCTLTRRREAPAHHTPTHSLCINGRR